MVDAEIKPLLLALKGGIEATVVGIIDGAHGWLRVSSEPSPGTFWAAFNDRTCLQGTWDDWDRELLASGSAGIVCRCGGHAVQAFAFNKRWILVVLGEGPLITGADKVIEHALKVLKGLLPTGTPASSSDPPAGSGSGGGGGGQGPAELGIPLAWIRKRKAD